MDIVLTIHMHKKIIFKIKSLNVKNLSIFQFNFSSMIKGTLWHFRPNLVVVWQLHVLYVYLSYKKGSIKNIKI